MGAVALSHRTMHLRPSHSALDDLLDLPSALEAQPAAYGGEQSFEAVQYDQTCDHTGTRGDPSSSLPAGFLWLPAPGSDCASKQRLSRPAALRQRAWPAATSGVVWVGEASGVEVCCAGTGGSGDLSQRCAASPPTVAAAAQGRRSKAAGRPCYQTVMKVCFTGRSQGQKSCFSVVIAPCMMQELRGRLAM